MKRSRLRNRSGSAVSGAQLLLGAETNGVAIDFTDRSVFVRDTVTPANSGSYTVDILTYTSPSAKWIIENDGLLRSGTAVRTEYSTTTALGVRIEEGRTNICLHSDNLANAAWTKTSATATQTATGPDGVANSASVLTATAGNATALQAITDASTARIASCYIKRRTGSGTVEMTQDNGTTWTPVTVTSAWTRVQIPSATLANPTVGLRVVTSGDAVDVAFFQSEAGAFITSPIRTTTASVARANDDLYFLLSSINFNATAITLHVEGTTFADASNTGYSGIEDNGAGLNYFLIRRSGTAGGMTLLSGGAAQASFSDGAYYAAGANVKSASSATANLFKWAVNGASPVADDTAGSMPVSPLRWNIGALAPAFGFWNGHIKRTMHLPRAMNTAELQALTT